MPCARMASAAFSRMRPRVSLLWSFFQGMQASDLTFHDDRHIVPYDRHHMVEEMLPDTPIVPALLRLGLPTMLVLLVQTGVGLAETWFVSFLGTTGLTAATVVFPAYMLMTMMANGGIGGGVSSAIARALGAGDRPRAESLAFHGLVLAFGFGALFTLAMWIGGETLYASMGARDASLAMALAYSNALFLGSVPV